MGREGGGGAKDRGSRVWDFRYETGCKRKNTKHSQLDLGRQGCALPFLLIRCANILIRLQCKRHARHNICLGFISNDMSSSKFMRYFYR